MENFQKIKQNLPTRLACLSPLNPLTLPFKNSSLFKSMFHSQQQFRLIDPPSHLPKQWQRCLYRSLRTPIDSFFAIKYTNEVYNRVVAQHDIPNFFIRALNALELTYEVEEKDLEKIPKEGPLLVVANHPFGSVDGIVLGALLTSVREDARLLANYLLSHMPEIQPWLLSVNPFGGTQASRDNLRALRQAIYWLQEGGCIGTFPAGTVSHLHLRCFQVTDPSWSAHMARLIHKSKAAVLPIFFEGKNSLFFQMAGLAHPSLRTMLLAKEMRHKRNQVIRVRVGSVIPYRRLSSFKNNEALTEFLRLNTYLLGKRNEKTPKRHRFPSLPRRTKKPPSLAPLETPVLKSLLEENIKALPEEQKLLENGSYAVYYAYAPQLPHILREIGYLREKTFREINEGTGKSLDLDDFDTYYVHLFIWDREQSVIVGAYRLGPTDTILKKQGKEGLYTSTLFKFKPTLLEQISPALEVGRSFIISEYQKKHASLALLWRGIGQFVMRNPRYKNLFGPVSINPNYDVLSRDLIVQFLRQNKVEPSLAPLVKARRPPRRRHIKGAEKRALQTAVPTIEDISALISEIEMDNKGIPVLLRQYLKLNGQLLSFNLDPDFGKCLDGLILVDLTKSDPKLIKAYMGTEGAKAFYQFHGSTNAPQIDFDDDIG